MTLDQITQLRTLLEEIITTRVMCCDGKPQGDYACDLHIKIAEQALALLPCPTCNGREVVRTPEMGGGDMPCPDCK